MKSFVYKHGLQIREDRFDSDTRLQIFLNQ